MGFYSVHMLYWLSNYILVTETLGKRHNPQRFKARRVHREGQCSKVTQFKVLPTHSTPLEAFPVFIDLRFDSCLPPPATASPSECATLRALCLTLSQQSHKQPWSFLRTWRLPKYQNHFLSVVMNPGELQWPDSAVPHRNESIVCWTKQRRVSTQSLCYACTGVLLGPWQNGFATSVS